MTEFDQLVADEFGSARGSWIVHSHVLGGENRTAEELISAGVDPRDVWEKLCVEFDIPEERRLGVDRPGEKQKNPSASTKRGTFPFLRD